MSSWVQSRAEPGGSGVSPSGVDLGDFDVTFSAPFQTEAEL